MRRKRLSANVSRALGSAEASGGKKNDSAVQEGDKNVQDGEEETWLHEKLYLHC